MYLNRKVLILFLFLIPLTILAIGCAAKQEAEEPPLAVAEEDDKDKGEPYEHPSETLIPSASGNGNGSGMSDGDPGNGSRNGEGYETATESTGEPAVADPADGEHDGSDMSDDEGEEATAAEDDAETDQPARDISEKDVPGFRDIPELIDQIEPDDHKTEIEITDGVDDEPTPDSAPPTQEVEEPSKEDEAVDIEGEEGTPVALSDLEKETDEPTVPGTTPSASPPPQTPMDNGDKPMTDDPASADSDIWLPRQGEIDIARIPDIPDIPGITPKPKGVVEPEMPDAPHASMNVGIWRQVCENNEPDFLPGGYSRSRIIILSASQLRVERVYDEADVTLRWLIGYEQLAQDRIRIGGDEENRPSRASLLNFSDSVDSVEPPQRFPATLEIEKVDEATVEISGKRYILIAE